MKKIISVFFSLLVAVTLVPAAQAAKGGGGGSRPAPAAPAPRPVAQPQPRPVAAPPPPPRLSNAACCWPLGEPGKAGFRFCAERALAGKPYCEAHASQAYVRAKPKQEDAA